MICSKEENGSYVALCPELRGCFTQGDTYEDAVANLKDLVTSTIEDLDADEMENIPSWGDKIFSEFEVVV